MTKSCSGCKKIKNLEEFSKNSATKDGYNIKCRECTRAYSNAWYDAHKENYKIYYSQNKEYQGEYQAKYRKNAEKRPIYLCRQSTWRAYKAGRVPKWFSEETFDKCVEVYREAVILTIQTGVEQEVDHIIPLNHKLVSGLHVPWNLEVITAAENIIKLDKFDGTQDNKSWKVEAQKMVIYLQDKYNKF